MFFQLFSFFQLSFVHAAGKGVGIQQGKIIESESKFKHVQKYRSINTFTKTP